MSNFIIFQMKGPSSGGVTGGAEKYGEELAFVLEAMGHDVEIYCGRDKDEETLPAIERRTDKISVHRFNSLFSFLPLSIFSMHFHYLFRARKTTDYVIENQWVIPLFTPIYKKSLFTIIHHLTGKDYVRKQGYIKGSIGIFLEDKLMPFIYRNQKVLTVSEHSKESIVAVGFKPDAISVIPPIVSILADRFPNKQERKNIISYVGRYTGSGGNKRIDHVIEVMPEVLKQVPDAKLIIGGSMKKKEELLKIIEENNLQDCVEFRGFMTDEQKFELMSQSKVFASPSYQEGFGMTYIEAHACGTPVVGYEVEGLNTVPTNSGYMVEKDDKAALKAAIVELLSDNDKWLSMSRAALENANKFKADTVREQYRQYLNARISERIH